MCAFNYGFPLLYLSVSLCYLGHSDIATVLFLLSLCSYHCLYANISSSSFPSSTVGPSQGLPESLRHEAAQQVRDDQTVRLSFLLGGEAHHGLFQQSLDRPGVCPNETQVLNVLHRQQSYFL